MRMVLCQGPRMINPLCGCPKSGMVALEALLSRTSIGNYRNGKDPVPDLPVPLKPLLEWRDMAPMTLLNEAPQDSNPFAWHHIALYQRGVRALP